MGSDKVESLYNGEVTLWRDADHVYTVCEMKSAIGDDFIFPPKVEVDASVTQVTQELSKAAPLMQWAANLASETWKNRILNYAGRQLPNPDEVHDEARFAHRKRKKEAAEHGTDYHAMLTSYVENILSHGPPWDHGKDKLPVAFFLWCHDHDVDWTRTGRMLWIRSVRVAGEDDLEAEVDGRICQIEVKTSGGIYPEYRLQTAAYNQAVLEESGKLRGRWCLRFGKDGSFEAVNFEPDPINNLLHGRDWQAFCALLQIFRWKKKVEK